MCFVKSVDASNIVKDAHNISMLLSDVIDWIGSENVVHVVTDSAANMVAVGRKITSKYGNIYWSPCVAHALKFDAERYLLSG
ncbi:unnamed protein product [Linum trigynum]|uniref:DUF659 domain-containing protein n=1 Tax=Linum trigynum TaxID=586398 RepID=A0AAV2FVL8_9ROSI